MLNVVANFHQVVRLDVKERVAYLENGKSVTYDKCLIATGLYVCQSRMTSALLPQVCMSVSHV